MASKKPSSSSSSGTGTSETGPSYEDIARRSYELYLARGGNSTEVQQLEDWLKAEAELRGTNGVSKPS